MRHEPPRIRNVEPDPGVLHHAEQSRDAALTQRGPREAGEQVRVSAQTRVVLVGPPECGKTTLLLRFCVRYVRENPDGRVLYIASERAMDRARVHATRDELLKDDPRALDRIGIKYAEDDQDVRALCCFRHAAPANAQPTAYVVDDLGSLIKCVVGRIE